VTRAAHLLLAAAGLFLLPFALRAANHLHPPPNLQSSYLPALEGPRPRAPFNAEPIGDLRIMNPTWIVIGDSMAGSRFDPPLFRRLTSTEVAPLLWAGSGPSWWYLAFKNWVVPSGVHPRAVFVFFRDTNLTDVMFRIDASWALDTVALAHEDELNAAVARRQGTPLYQVREAADALYEAPQARRWLEPLAEEWPARALFAYRRPRARFFEQLNTRLGLEHLRPMDAADMQETEDRDADFDGFVDKSALPLMLRDARPAGLCLCFVRVQRRPEGSRPPYQSPALRRYMSKLRTYIEQRGGLLVDDTGDTAQDPSWYGDGDHLSDQGRVHYTELFVARLRQRFP
jgi:hypothetical protein